MNRIGLVVPFENRISHHEGVILRSAISMKFLYPDLFNIIVVTSLTSYIDILHGNWNHGVPVNVVDWNTISMYPISNYKFVVNCLQHPDISKADTKELLIHVLPTQSSQNLDFDSLVFGNRFDLPDSAALQILVPKKLRKSV